MTIDSIKDVRTQAHLEQYLVARYGGFHEHIIVPQEVWILLLKQAEHKSRMPGNPPRLRLLMGNAQYEVIVESAGEVRSRLIKGTLDLAK